MKNYPTDLVGMYLDGNYTGKGTPDAVGQSVENIRQTTPAETVRVRVADYLKELATAHAQAFLKDENTLAGDLLNAALSEVDWLELADAELSER